MHLNFLFRKESSAYELFRKIDCGDTDVHKIITCEYFFMNSMFAENAGGLEVNNAYD